MISPCRGNSLHNWGTSKVPESSHPRQQERNSLIKAVPLLIQYDLQIPSKPLQNQIASSPGQSCRNSSENLPRSCHGAGFPLATLYFWDALEESLLTKRVGKVREQVEQMVRKNSLTGTQIWHNVCGCFPIHSHARQHYRCGMHLLPLQCWEPGTQPCASDCGEATWCIGDVALYAGDVADDKHQLIPVCSVNGWKADYCHNQNISVLNCARFFADFMKWKPS